MSPLRPRAWWDETVECGILKVIGVIQAPIDG